MKALSQFRPAFYFVGKFLLIYFIGNVIYGLWVESYGERPDAITKAATEQTAWCLEIFGYEAETEDNLISPTVFILAEKLVVLSVFEGCNGINVMIVFVAFVVAFSGPLSAMAWFIPAG